MHGLSKNSRCFKFFLFKYAYRIPSVCTQYPAVSIVRFFRQIYRVRQAFTTRTRVLRLHGFLRTTSSKQRDYRKPVVDGNYRYNLPAPGGNKTYTTVTNDFLHYASVVGALWQTNRAVACALPYGATAAGSVISLVPRVVARTTKTFNPRKSCPSPRRRS